MKNFTFTLLASAIVLTLSAQPPQSFKYQAVARDNAGNVITNQNVSFRVSILQSSSSGTEAYIETHAATTNDFGLVNLEIGSGTVVSGVFSTIAWESGPYFLKIEMDETGGNNFQVIGTSQLLSVPYALHSKTTETIADKGIATYRWATFCTYDQILWAFGNWSSLTGGVPPSWWTENNAIASDLSHDKEILRTLFTNKGYAKSNAMILNNVFLQVSSENGQVVMALFRIRNNTNDTIDWIPYFLYSCYGNWGERASAALNGVSKFVGTYSSYTNITLPIPPNRVSTAIFVSTSGTAISTPVNDLKARTCRLAFFNNSLDLPEGLEFVDDLDTATGGWEQ